MTGGLKVCKSGLHTTVQDLGRFGHQRSGVPVSGALDPVSLRMANVLVGNPPTASVLEILFQGPTLKVDAEAVRVALAGTDMGLELLDDSARRLPSWQSVRLCRGQTFRIGSFTDSACCYLAVEGGIDVPVCLGSIATYVRGGLGGIEGRALREGDQVPLKKGAAPERNEVRLARPPAPGLEAPVRVVPGPQADAFTEAAFETLLSAEYIVSKDFDRMGMRLEGPRLDHKGDFNIVSDGIATGAIQVPGSGRPIILLADRQTTGGYPKIATVASVDISAVVRRRPGSPIRFVAMDVGEAEQARREQERALEALSANLASAPEVSGLDLERLYSSNLISGVSSAGEPEKFGRCGGSG